MEFVEYGIWAALILIGLSVLCTLLFSLRGLLYGKLDVVSLAVMAVPFVIFIILGLTMATWVVAGIWTMLILFVLALLALLLSGTFRYFV